MKSKYRWLWPATGLLAIMLLLTCSPGIYLVDCPNGVVVDGVCRPKNCENRTCPEGFFCDNDSGQCVQINCLYKQCPEGFVCANNQCYPKDCETRNCPGIGDVCINEECVPASCVGVSCPPDQRCAQGQCYPIDCPTKTCPGNYQVCVNDQCTEQSCVGVTCPAGQRCAQGVCYPADCGETGCFGEGEVCVDGVCTRTACAGVNCPAGQVCANGWCYPNDCADKDCSDYGEVCFQNQCVPADCVGITCPAGQACARGQCFPLDCGGTTCQPPYVCVNNQCQRSNCVGVQCPPGQTCADGQCFPRDCQDTGCAAGEVCVNGQCLPADCSHVQCPAGQVCAADLQCHPADCATPCGPYEVCVNNTCVDRMCVGVSCPAGQICLAGRCYDPNDPSCSPPCSADQICENGMCIPRDCANWRCCPPFDCTTQNQCVQYTCDGGAVFTCLFDGQQPVWSEQGSSCTDNNPCTINDTCQGGSCQAVPMPCDTDEVCVQGVCRCGGVGPDCTGNQTCCTHDNQCHDLATDIDNCGACNAPCRRNHATPACRAGICQIGVCDALWDNCNGQDADGCETSLETLTDCGTCGTPCSAPNAEVSCSGGTCHITNCPSLRGDCDGNINNGCEQSLDTVQHCGACNTPCSRANASATCPNGVCQIDQCNSGWGNCDGQDANGCEDSLDSLQNCGGCNTPCSRAHATASCSGDVCHIQTCDALWGNCNGIDSDGCETSMETLTDCGACNTPCSRTNATATCTGGICHIASCNPGWGNCDGLDANGCENSLDSLEHCGACNTPCTRDHATASCTGDVCHIQSCDTNWGNCDSVDANGCETDLLSTAAHCGACGNSCGQNALCTGGNCACQANYANCNGTWTDGCEVNLLTDSANCGACGNNCGQNAYCNNGSCACLANYGNCDGSWANGCEVNLRTDANNCGSCGNRCGANAYCNNGNCACNSLWGNCNNNWADGCETALTSLTNCGGCGVTCSLPNANETCASGSCQIASCDTNYGNCDGITSNGCEQLLNTLQHCGACNNPCSRANATATCQNFICQIASCNPGYWNIDNIDSNGCECGDPNDVANTCNESVNLGSISGSQIIQRNGVIAHRSGYIADMDCYYVNFTASNPANGGGKLSVSLSGENVNYYVWEGNCSNQICSHPADRSASTECLSTGGVCEAGNNHVVFVCVDVENAGTATCSGYTLTFQATP